MRLGDHHDPGGITTGDLVTNINLLETNATIDWCGNPAPVELQLRAGNACFISLNGAFGFTDQRLLGIQLLAGNEIVFCQLLITRQVTAGVGKRGFIFASWPWACANATLNWLGSISASKSPALTCWPSWKCNAISW